MDDLSKHQVILVALLVSFVTSLATGIVTVSLLDQAPDGTTRTVSQVIEKTIQQIVPADSAATTANAVLTNDPALAAAVIRKSLVRFKSRSTINVSGVGFIVAKSGIVITDKTVIARLPDYVGVLADGTEIPFVVIQSEDQGDIVFLAPSPSSIRFAAVTLGSTSPTLGESILTLSGTSTDVLGQGLIDEMTPSGSVNPNIQASIPHYKVTPGTPLFDFSGQVIGLRTSSLASADSDVDSTFYPIDAIRTVIPGLK